MKITDKLSWLQIRIFSVTWLAYFGFYLTRKSFSVAKIGIEADQTIDVSLADMAWIDGAYLVMYAAGQIIWGALGDKLGTRKVILGGMLLSVVVGFAMGLSSITLALGVFFLIQGLAQSTGWAPLVKNVCGFFSEKNRGTLMGLWCTNYALGGLVASGFAGYCGDQWGWRYAFFVPAGCLFGIWLLFFFFQKDAPKDGSEVGETQAQPQTSFFAVFKNRNVLLLGFTYFLLKPTRYAVLFWGPKYINSKLGTGMTESGLISGMFEAMGIASTLLAGVLSDRLFKGRRIPICVLSLGSLGIFLFFFDYLPANAYWLIFGFFFMGLTLYGPDSILSSTAAVDFAGEGEASSAAGLVNGLGSVGAIIGGTIPGFFAAEYGWSGIFTFLGCMVLLASVLLISKWNAQPKS